MIVTLDGGEEMFDLKRQFIERLVYATSLLQGTATTVCELSVENRSLGEKRVLLFPNQVFIHLELYWTSSFILKQTCIQEKALTNFNRPLRKSSENSATWRYIRGFCSS